MLEVNDIHTYYGASYVLQGVSLSVAAGQIVVLFGRNGVGKTTTIRSIVGFASPRRGRIVLNGREITRSPSYEIAQLGVGLVPQGRHVFRSLTVEEHLVLGEYRGNPATPWNRARLFELFPRLDQRRNQLAHTLSGGEQSMLSIGRALIMNPTLLVMDEPTEGLSPLIVRQVADTIATLKAARQSILLVEQNIAFALDLADFVYVMSKGKIVFAGTPLELKQSTDVERRYLGFGQA
jgi:branched-chain amino acid transport system ATP-binding protein